MESKKKVEQDSEKIRKAANSMFGSDTGKKKDKH